MSDHLPPLPADVGAIARCLDFVGQRLLAVRRHASQKRRDPSARQIRALELLAAACIAEAAFVVEATVPRRPAEADPGHHPDPSVRGAWSAPR